MFDWGFKDGPPDKRPDTKGEKTFVWILVAIFGAMILAAIFSDFEPRKLSIIFFLVSWPILLIIHEFGHALMAKWLGWEVLMMAIGSGKVRATKTIFGMKVEFRTIPLSGFARTRAADLIQPQMKNFLIYAAGPGIEIAAVLLLAIALGKNEMLSQSDHIGIIAAQSFSAAALLGAIINLIPFPHHTEHGMAWSDGLGMIMSWRLPDSYFAQQIR
ncbi:M50 family metallopeptidase [bacterium]|nr:M50 family metallopeptidase [bacterium]